MSDLSSSLRRMPVAQKVGLVTQSNLSFHFITFVATLQMQRTETA